VLGVDVSPLAIATAKERGLATTSDYSGASQRRVDC
jgi:hypothetical protein